MVESLRTGDFMTACKGVGYITMFYRWIPPKSSPADDGHLQLTSMAGSMVGLDLDRCRPCAPDGKLTLAKCI